MKKICTKWNTCTADAIMMMSSNYQLYKTDAVHKVALKMTSGWTYYLCEHNNYRLKLGDQNCHKCGKKGYLAKVCKSSVTSQQEI